MKRVAIIMAVLAISAGLGCNKKESSQSPSAAPPKVEGKRVNAAPMNDKELALAFLGGIQAGDKKLMYRVSNLTPELVEESREKLTNTVKYKQSKKERAETEHALRMSGNIDFFLKKLTSILPKSARLEVIETNKGAGETRQAHDIKISYVEQNESMGDKDGKKIREMLVTLQQIKHVVNGIALQEFVFDSADLEKMATRNFVVLSYY